MFDLPPLLSAILTGLLSGSLLSIPVGPINLTIFNEGARRGFRWAALIGFGASSMEVLYCGLAFTGIASFLNQGVIKTVMEVGSVVFLLFLGFRYLLLNRIPVATGMEESLEHRFHPHSAFMTGFVRVMGNPNVLLSWIVLAASFTAHDWVEPTFASKLACCCGVALGTNLWFLFLSYAVSVRRGKFGEQTLVKIEKASGVGLIIMAVVQVVNIVLHLPRHH